MTTITLASSSPYRQELLARLNLDFNCLSPDIDESAHAGETPSMLVRRLAEQKARAVATQAEGLIIASDQVACLEQTILTKPGNFDNALAQLSACCGKQVTFYTGLVLFNTESQALQSAVETTEVLFRQLPEQQLRHYLEAEQPFDCAGSFKVEGLGISLFSAIKGDDPNVLVGLPLIRLVEFLNNEGVIVP